MNLGVKDLTSTSQIARAADQLPRAGADGLQLPRRSCSATRTSILTEGGTNGQLLRFSIVTPPGSLAPAPNNEGSPSTAPANGPATPPNDPTNYLHSNPYPFTAAPGQPRTCEAGNEQFLAGRQVIGNVPGQKPTTLHENTAP